MTEIVVRCMHKRRINSFAGTFLAVSLAIGIASYASSHSMPGTIALATVAGALAALLIGRFDRSAAARLHAYGLRDGDYPARISVVAAVRADPEVVFATCERSIKNLPNFGTITRHDKKAGVLRCRTRRSIQSWGENISIDLEPRGALTLLHLKSEPALWTVTEDMRMNYQNVALIVRDIQGAHVVENLEPLEYFSGSADTGT